MNDFIIREASSQDYPGFSQMESQAWTESGLEIIDQETFVAWTETFPEGCLVAVSPEGKIVGHIYAQICDFDPNDPEDTQKDYQEITGGGETRTTHDMKHSFIYIVSVSSIVAGAGTALTKKIFDMCDTYKKPYSGGACRLVKFAQYCKDYELSGTRPDVWTYVQLHMSCLSEFPRSHRDSVLSVFLAIPGLEIYDVVPDFLSPLDDVQSLGWACVIAYKPPIT